MNSMDIFICWQANIIILIPRFSFIPKEGRLCEKYAQCYVFLITYFFFKSVFFFLNFQTEYFPNKNLSKCCFKKIRRDDPCIYMKHIMYCFCTPRTLRYTEVYIWIYVGTAHVAHTL